MKKGGNDVMTHRIELRTSDWYSLSLLLMGTVMMYINLEILFHWLSGVKRSQKCQGPVGPLALKIRAVSFISGSDLVFLISFLHQILKIANIFKGIGPLVLTFCRPSPNFEGNWPKGSPYFDPCVYQLWCFISLALYPWMQLSYSCLYAR